MFGAVGGPGCWVSLAPSPQAGMDSRAWGAAAPGYERRMRARTHQGVLPPLLFPCPRCCGRPWGRRDECLWNESFWDESFPVMLLAVSISQSKPLRRAGSIRSNDHKLRAGPEPMAPADVGDAPACVAVLGSEKVSGSASPAAVWPRPCPHQAGGRSRGVPLAWCSATRSRQGALDSHCPVSLVN